jgi:hypothetical protein
MGDGTTKPIRAVTVKDFVVATDPQTGKTTSEPVVSVHFHVDVDLADVTVVDTGARVSVLHTTQNHRFWDETTKSWVPAVQLKIGDRLRTARGYASVGAVRTFTKPAGMYNLTIHDVHTYYVVAGDNPVLVHNDPGGGWDPDWENMDWDPGNSDDDGNRTPQGNQVQNRSFDDAVREAERRIGRSLSQDEIRRLHESITKQGYGYHQIVTEAESMFGGC